MDYLANLKNLLTDPQNSLSMGIVKELDLASDRSVLRCVVTLWPDNIDIVARVTWDFVGPNAGIIAFPAVGDLVIVAVPEKDVDSAIVIRRMSSKEDVIPETAVDGSLVLRAVPGKKTWLTSGTRINLSRGDTEPGENLVIGQVFKTVYLDHLSKLIDLVDKLITERQTDATHNHIGIFGVPVNTPIQSGTMLSEKAELEALKSEVETLKTDEVESENILSDVAFTEK